eukprot:SAG31_NODE_41047_length_278_cov_0.569832_1_plen_38_part_01
MELGPLENGGAADASNGGRLFNFLEHTAGLIKAQVNMS